MNKMQLKNMKIIMENLERTGRSGLCPFEYTGNLHLRDCKSFCGKIFPRLVKDIKTGLTYIGAMKCPCLSTLSKAHIIARTRKVIEQNEQDNDS